ncbi:integrase core domain-containing protein [Paraburkholderia fungorum]|uniref:integrase core domain-containing protein n=1 Tax=Paraburkholderia fungorum TaxID=134537 RepID=UPI0038BA423C
MSDTAVILPAALRAPKSISQHRSVRSLSRSAWPHGSQLDRHCRLGIRISYSRPYHPQTNGKDERFHRTLKAEVLNGRSFATQQHVQQELDRWRTIYNCERPHEAIGMNTPISRYQPSPRAYPSILREPEYGPDDVVLRVKSDGRLRFEGRKLKVSDALYGLPVAARAKPGEDGVFEFWFAHHRILTLELRSNNP